MDAFSCPPTYTCIELVWKHEDGRKFYFTCNYVFVEMMNLYYSSLTNPKITTDTIEFVKILDGWNTRSVVGYNSQPGIDEPGKTAVLVPHMPLPQFPIFCRYVWLHQCYLLVRMNNSDSKISSKVDMSMYAEFYSIQKQTNVLFPLVICGVSQYEDLSEKRYELFNIANSMILYQMQTSFKWPLLGIIFNDTEFEVHVYFVSNDVKDKLVDITLFKEQRSDSVIHWQALFDMMKAWCVEISNIIQNAVSMKYQAQVRVVRNKDQSYVYKSFDYRYVDPHSIVRKRSPKLYFDKKLILTEVEELVNVPGLVIIKYGLIKGTHVAVCCKQFISILEQLEYLHSKLGIVHGDIRLANMVFNDEEYEKSTLLDYDYCGMVDVDHYPSGILNVVDGYRTSKMLGGGVMRYKDDCKCMYKCMKFFQSNEKDDLLKWKQIYRFVKHGLLEKAIDSLNNNNEFTLELVNPTFCNLKHGTLCKKISMAQVSNTNISIPISHTVDQNDDIPKKKKVRYE